MKDIYSPLEIDEEWDQRAPDMGGNEGGGTAVAVAPAAEATNDAALASETVTSTLSPDQVADTTPDVSQVPLAGEAVEPSGDMAPDPAHAVAEAAVSQPVPVVDTDTDTDTDTVPDTLDISEMSSKPSEPVMPEGAVIANDNRGDEDESVVEPEEDGQVEVSGMDAAEPTKVNVMGDTEDESATKAPEAGSVIEPQVKPDGLEDVIPEPAADEPEADETPVEEPELPASPQTTEEVDEPTEEPIEAKEVEMDSTDKRFMAAIEEWNKAKQRANERLTGLMTDVEADIDRTRAEIADLEAHVDTKEKEKEDIQAQLDELGEVSPAA